MESLPSKDWPEDWLITQLKKASKEVKTWPEWMKYALEEERAYLRLKKERNW